jgi:hypothetical protein
MRRFILGTTVGFLAASTLAWAFTVQFPNVLRVQGRAIVDEAGNVLGGTTPLKVSLTEAPEPPVTSQVVLDDIGAIVGTVSRPVTGNDPVFITREVGPVTAEFVATHLSLVGNSGGSLYYESPGCTGQAFANLTGGFFPVSYASATTLYYAAGPQEPVNIQSRHSIGQSGPGSCSSEIVSTMLHPVGILDLTQFVPPFAVVTQ